MDETGLLLRPLGIDTHQKFVIYMRRDCHICRAEGFEAQTRVEVTLRDRHIIAKIDVVGFKLLAQEEVSLSTSAWRALGAASCDTIFHPPNRIALAPAPAASVRELLPSSMTSPSFQRKNHHA